MLSYEYLSVSRSKKSLYYVEDVIQMNIDKKIYCHNPECGVAMYIRGGNVSKNPYFDAKKDMDMLTVVVTETKVDPTKMNMMR